MADRCLLGWSYLIVSWCKTTHYFSLYWFIRCNNLQITHNNCSWCWLVAMLCNVNTLHQITSLGVESYYLGTYNCCSYNEHKLHFRFLKLLIRSCLGCHSKRITFYPRTFRAFLHKPVLYIMQSNDVFMGVWRCTYWYLGMVQSHGYVSRTRSHSKCHLDCKKGAFT